MIERTLKEIIPASGYLAVYKNEDDIYTLPVALWGRVTFRDTETEHEWIGVEGYIAERDGVENCEEYQDGFLGYCPAESFKASEWRHGEEKLDNI